MNNLFILSNIFLIFLYISNTYSSTSITVFDFYVFAQSWQAEYCYGNSQYGCGDPETYWENNWTLHGLWPNNADGTYPSYCTDEELSDDVINEVGWDKMVQYWPNADYPEDDVDDYEEFWDHEWTKHGTCSNLDQYDYFNDAINTLIEMGTPSIITDNIGGSVALTDLEDAYGGSSWVMLQCSGTYLSGAYSCWSYDSNFIPTKQMECPTQLLGEQTCSSDTINIASF